ncbi:DUF916 and DUF3324 domain-containing protein [Enterococcus ureasiticus]|uniref:Heme exporter protein D n=1 Tax=Enterococcus ureasiticus TaxID=903984 RepID=A0A1E5GHF1_9ENTE|nr:DUF916 and DUF3324 domain-containing protein [Enterococcus ureasiticus]OEG12109.1 hypothetical protein BCR21_07685 [Enterococcus ureasiticus]
MKRLIPVILTMIGFVAVGFTGGQHASAEEMSFSVEAKLPENQRDKSKTYFDLRVKPGETQELEVELKNNTDKDVTVQTKANTAITNDNGVIDYGAVDPKLDKTLAYPFGKLAKVDPEVQLAPKETKLLKVQVALPSETFNGIILGGLHFTQKEEKAGENKESGVQIENKFAYVIGVRLSENDDEVKPELQLTGAKAGQRNYRNNVLGTLQNPTPRILGNMTVTADVFAINNQEAPVFHNKQENLNMAPNSSFNYGIPTANKPFKAGKYILKMAVEAAGEKWEFEKEFEIKEDEAKKLNDDAVELAEEDSDYTLYFIIGGAVFGVVIIGLIIWMIRQRKKHQEELRRKEARKKAKRARKNREQSGNKKKKPSEKRQPK